MRLLLIALMLILPAFSYAYADEKFLDVQTITTAEGLRACHIGALRL